MQLRPYQEKVLSQLNERFAAKEKEVVIAASPSSGKTFMMLSYIKANPNANFLILTHGTNILKDQWEEELKTHNIRASQEPGKEKVTYGIPQGLRHKDLGKIDVLIIDEAHEFNFAKTNKNNTDYESMVKKIKKATKPSKIIYLTGTPSKFIRVGYKPIIIPAVDLVKDGFISDLYIGMVATKADIKNDDYNIEGNLKETIDQKLVDSAEDDIDKLVEAIVERLKVLGPFKSKSEWVGFSPIKLASKAFGKLKKTMIACNSIAQAEKINSILLSKGIKSIVSHSKEDINSENISKFVKDKTITVLVVVDRGILGFNMPELVNVVDLTGSRNIDRIYQLYARVMRKGADKEKFFFKFTDVKYRDLMKFYMAAAICLMYEHFIEKYNGKNLNAMEIPVQVIRQPRDSKKRNKEESEDTKTVSKKVKYSVDPLLEQIVLATVAMNNLKHNISDFCSEYASITFAQLKHQALGGEGVLRDSQGRKNVLLELAKSGSPKPSQYSKDPETKRLGQALRSYISQTEGTFDPQFTEEIKALRPDWFKDTAQLKKNTLLELAKSGGPKPFWKSSLGKVLNNYTGQTHGTFDLQFTEEIKALRPDWFEDTAQLKKNTLLALAKSGGPKPFKNSKDPETKRLGQALTNYIKQSHDSFDPQFTEEIKALRPDWFTGKRGRPKNS
jgi:superfamily II DNA or RNA helicase